MTLFDTQRVRERDAAPVMKLVDNSVYCFSADPGQIASELKNHNVTVYDVSTMSEGQLSVFTNIDKSIFVVSGLDSPTISDDQLKSVWHALTTAVKIDSGNRAVNKRLSVIFSSQENRDKYEERCLALGLSTRFLPTTMVSL